MRNPPFWNFPRVLLICAVLFWAGNFVVGRAISGNVPPIALAFWRWAGGSLLALMIARPHLRRDWPVLKRHWPILLLLAAFGISTYNTMVYTGLATTTAINASLMQSAMPMLIMASAFLLFGERVGIRQITGLAVSLVGVAVIATRGAPTELLSLSLNPGDAWIMGAVLAYALYSTLLRKRPAVHPLTFLCTTFALGAVMLLPFYLWEHAQGARFIASTTSLAALGYVIVFPGMLAYLFYNRGVELLGSARAGLFIHLMPVFGSLLAVVFLNEQIHLFHAAGIILIGLGIALATARKPA
jgi:drug/metabolite transporter (DMT)-like permease